MDFTPLPCSELPRWKSAWCAICTACGAPLAAPEPAAREPCAYTPQRLAEKILRSRAALEGEARRRFGAIGAKATPSGLRECGALQSSPPRISTSVENARECF